MDVAREERALDQKSCSGSGSRAVASSSLRARRREVADVKAALLGGLGDSLGEVERVVEELHLPARAGSHRRDDRPLGSRGDDRLRDPLHPHARPRSVAAGFRPERLERIDLVRANVLPEPEKDHPWSAVGHATDYLAATRRAARSVSTTRSWSSRSRRAWNGIAIVRALQSSLTGQSPSANPNRSRMYDWRWIEGGTGAVDTLLAHPGDQTRHGRSPPEASRRRRTTTACGRSRRRAGARRRGLRATRRSARRPRFEPARIRSSFSSWAIPSAAEMSSSR